MKKITLVLAVLFALNLSAIASRPILTWECNDILVSFNDDNTMSVGELVYQIEFTSDRDMLLYHGDVEMFHVINLKNGTGNLVFTYVVNGKVCRKEFVKCK